MRGQSPSRSPSRSPPRAHRLSRGRARSRRTPGASAALMAGGGAPGPPAAPFHRPGPAPPRPRLLPRAQPPPALGSGPAAKPALPLGARPNKTPLKTGLGGGKRGEVGGGGEDASGVGAPPHPLPSLGLRHLPRVLLFQRKMLGLTFPLAFPCAWDRALAPRAQLSHAGGFICRDLGSPALLSHGFHARINPSPRYQRIPFTPRGQSRRSKSSNGFIQPSLL